MITYKDCPECGARKIHSTVRVCEVCETWTKAHAEGFRRGAEAMREACAKWMSEREGIAQWVYDDALSALPIPEET